MCQECKTIVDEVCDNCRGKEELCDSCFQVKIKKAQLRKEMKEKFGF